MYKVDNGWEPTVYHKELYLMGCGDLHGMEIQKGRDMCICVADSRCCTAEKKHKIARQLYSNKNNFKNTWVSIKYYGNNRVWGIYLPVDMT